MKENLVSIITPMYNSQKYIEDVIQSVQGQTYKEWEMIIVDDCSSDQGPEIVKRLQSYDERIKYYRNEYNCGVAATRNRAIGYASGRFLAFLDSDDQWYPSKIERQLEEMHASQSAFCYTACDVIDQDGNQINVRRVPEKIDYQELLKGNVIPCLTVLIDRKKIPDIEMPYIPHEDYATWLKILKSGVKAYGIDETLAAYRESNKSLSSNKIKAMRWTWDIYRRFLGMNIGKSVFCFCHYVINALRKRNS